MRPVISDAIFGRVTVEGSKIKHDIIIRLSGEVQKREKKLSKAIYGTSHTISLEEAGCIYQDGAERLIIGSGHQGMMRLSEEAADYFRTENCAVELQPTPRAIECWNKVQGAVIGLFHVTS